MRTHLDHQFTDRKRLRPSRKHKHLTDAGVGEFEMTTFKSLRREPGRESMQSSDQLFSSVWQRREGAGDPSAEAKDHLTAVESIASGSLNNLKDVSNDIDKLRDEITLRARMIAEATARLDELQRKAGTGYGTIRNAIDMIREEYAAIPAPEPSIDPVTKDKPEATTLT